MPKRSRAASIDAAGWPLRKHYLPTSGQTRISRQALPETRCLLANRQQ
jgi:hypothetical protein